MDYGRFFRAGQSGGWFPLVVCLSIRHISETPYRPSKSTRELKIWSWEPVPDPLNLFRHGNTIELAEENGKFLLCRFVE